MLTILGHYETSTHQQHNNFPPNVTTVPSYSHGLFARAAGDGKTVPPSSLYSTIEPADNSTGFGPKEYIQIAQYSGIILLNLLSALFSGLVLGLLSLDVTELEILRKCGTEKERQYASTIIPMRRNSNLLLCSLVIGNVMVNAALQMLLDIVFAGLVGFITTTICITLFGEILPQAVCARHGLAIGAKTVWITWVVIVVTFPVAYPLSLVLDFALGEEISFVYDRERLQEYIRLTRGNNIFDAQEINIITGALKIKKVPVGHVMTKLKDVFMLPLDTIINYQTIMTIVKRGFSRIPVFDRARRNIVGLLMVKDLALVNPYAEVTLKSLVLFYKHPIILVDENHTLDIVFNHFREGKSHMAFVREHKKHDILGIVTLEDIIEEVLQVEINDETDIVTDNRELKLRPDAQIPTDLDALRPHLNEAIARRRAKERLMGQQHAPPVARTLLMATSPATRSASRSRQNKSRDHSANTKNPQPQQVAPGTNKSTTNLLALPQNQTPHPAASPHRSKDKT